MSDDYDPLKHSIVQACMPGPKWNKYEAPAFVVALLEYIVNEAGRVAGNVRQDRYALDRIEEIQGFELRPYGWDCNCGSPVDDQGDEVGPHHENCAFMLPNLRFGDVSVSWYKHLGRGTSVSENWTAEQWRVWFDGCLEHLKDWERRHPRTRYMFGMLWTSTKQGAPTKEDDATFVAESEAWKTKFAPPRAKGDRR